MKILKKLKLIIKNDGYLKFPITLLLLCKNRLIRLYYYLNYGFDDAWFGESPVLINIRQAQIGKKFHAQRLLRFEIITEHNNKEYFPVCIVGNNVRISDFGHIGCCNKLIIGNDVLIGSKVYISDHGHGVYSGTSNSSSMIPPNDRELYIGTVEIGNNVYIGDNVSILPNVKIEDGVIIAANSVVVSNSLLERNTIYAGIPVKKIKKYNEQLHMWVFVK